MVTFLVEIKNKQELLKNTNSLKDRKAREIILEVIEKTLTDIDPKKIINSQIFLKNNTLQIKKEKINLNNFENIILIGGGKATGSMAEAFADIIKDKIVDGLIVVPKGTSTKYNIKNVKIQESSHPIPDEMSVDGANKLLSLASRAGKNDLVICLISGGGSSLMALPKEGIALKDKKKLNNLLLKSGASINEINTVRKHISGFKGGQLAKKIYPATMINLFLSDVIGDKLESIASGPTVPDPTTYQESKNILNRYNLWEISPKSIRTIISKGINGFINDTPKKNEKYFKKSYNIVIGNNYLACKSAINTLNEMGLNTALLSSSIEGEAREVGLMLGSIARETATSRSSLRPPIGIVTGGETTVKVIGNGKGGRNQELSLSAANKISKIKGISIASFSTDGIDGPTDAAGAIIDSGTIARSQKLKLNYKEYLKNNNTYTFFSLIGDLILTGYTGTNINDITISVIL
jgi:glycerate-2-kinase